MAFTTPRNDDEPYDDDTTDPRLDTPGSGPGNPADLVAVDGAEWEARVRTFLEALLVAEGIEHVWQGATLMIAADDEPAVSALLDEVNSAGGAVLDPERERVAYEVGGWPPSLLATLVGALTVAGIDHEWDGSGDLVVYEDDDERVEEILDSLPDPDDEPAADDDGIEAQAVLTSLWQAVGTLSRRPGDSHAVLSLIEVADRLDSMSLPFGFDRAVWDDLSGRAAALRSALDSSEEAEQLTDDELRDLAGELRTMLRPFV